jgi:hypothetical protein
MHVLSTDTFPHFQENKCAITERNAQLAKIVRKHVKNYHNEVVIQEQLYLIAHVYEYTCKINNDKQSCTYLYGANYSCFWTMKYA